MNHSHSLWRAEARLLLRSNRNVLALILLLVLSAASVWSGIVQVCGSGGKAGEPKLENHASARSG